MSALNKACRFRHQVPVSTACLPNSPCTAKRAQQRCVRVKNCAGCAQMPCTPLQLRFYKLPEVPPVPIMLPTANYAVDRAPSTVSTRVVQPVWPLNTALHCGRAPLLRTASLRNWRTAFRGGFKNQPRPTVPFMAAGTLRDSVDGSASHTHNGPRCSPIVSLFRTRSFNRFAGRIWSSNTTRNGCVIRDRNHLLRK